MTSAAGYSPPGQNPLLAKALPAEGNLVPDTKLPERYRCTAHGVRLAKKGASLACEHGCQIVPPGE